MSDIRPFPHRQRARRASKSIPEHDRRAVSDPESFDAVIRRAFEKHPSASVTETETSAIVDEVLSDLRLRGRLARTDRTVGAPERGALPRGFTAVDRTAGALRVSGIEVLRLGSGPLRHERGR